MAEYHGPRLTFMLCADCGKSEAVKDGEDFHCDCPRPSRFRRALWSAEEALLGLRYRLGDALVALGTKLGDENAR